MDQKDEPIQQLDDGINTHLNWVAKFRGAAFTEAHMDREEVLRDNCCALGQWIYGIGATTCGSEGDYVKLREVHQAFHREAAHIADLINDGQTDAAIAASRAGTPFMDLSVKVENAVRRLAVAMRKNAPH